MLDKAPALDIELRMKEGKLVGTATMYELENGEDGPYVMLHGVIQHTLYHAGQIALFIKETNAKRVAASN